MDSSYWTLFDELCSEFQIVRWVASPDGERFFFVSSSFLKVWGYSPEELYADPSIWKSAIVEQDRAEVLGLFKQLPDGGSFEWTYHIRRKDGVQRLIGERGLAIQDSETGEWRLMGVSEDVTDHEEAILRLAASEEKYRRIFEESPIPLLEMDLSAIKGRIDELAQSGRDPIAHLSAHPDEVKSLRARMQIRNLNKSAMHLVSAERREDLRGAILGGVGEIISNRFPDAMEGLLSEEKTYQGDISFETRNGVRLWLRLLSRIAPGAEGDWNPVRVALLDMTQMREAQHALESSELRYRSLFNGVPDAVIIVDVASLRNIDANPAALEMYGYEYDEFIGMRCMDYSAEPEETAARVREIPEDNVAFIPRRLHRRKNGEVFPVEINGRFFDIENRRVLVTVLRDITERSRMEDRLREESQFREAVIDRATEGICVCHADPEYCHKRLSVWNRRMEEITGYTMDEINELGSCPMLCCDPEARERAMARTEGLPEGNHIQGDEWNIRTKTGETRSISVSTTLLSSDKSGSYLLSVINDITARKVAEEEIRRMAQNQAKLYMNMHEGIVTFNSAGEIIDCNRAFASLLGSSKSELIGLAYESLATDGYRQEDVEHLREVEKEDYSGAYEKAFIGAGGTSVPVEVRLYRLSDANSDSVTWTAVVRDLSEQKRLEREIIEIGEESQRRMGHELHDLLGQQLTAISMTATGLQSSLEDQKDLNRIADCLGHMARKALADARRLAQGLYPAELERGDLVAAIESLSTGIRELFVVDCRFHSDLRTDVFDRMLALNIFRILQEACSNAIKHGKSSRIEITAGETDHALMFEVRDNGSGMTDRISQGKGLGISIMQYRAGAVGGRLSISSEAGKGTYLSLEVPFDRKRSES